MVQEVVICLICKDWMLGNLTIKEAFNNLRENFDENNRHDVDLWIKLLKAELDEEDTRVNGLTRVYNRVKHDR